MVQNSQRQNPNKTRISPHGYCTGTRTNPHASAWIGKEHDDLMA
jgi:hypothetical protein